MTQRIQEFTATVRIRFTGAPQVVTEEDVRVIVGKEMNVKGAEISMKPVFILENKLCPGCGEFDCDAREHAMYPEDLE